MGRKWNEQERLMIGARKIGEYADRVFIQSCRDAGIDTDVALRCGPLLAFIVGAA